MQHYSNDPAHCRVDFFKETGKWYCTEMVNLKNLWVSTVMVERFKSILCEHLTEKSTGRIRLSGMWAVCLEPYHPQSYPVMVRIP